LKAALLDSGAIVAMLDRAEQYHAVCRELVETTEVPLVTCEAVIAESCYLLRSVKGASEQILANVAAGIFQMPIPLSSAAGSVARILAKYADREIDLADACLIHLATELSVGDIFTLDRDFHVYRWGRNQPFKLLIPLR
jgi:predicted nucleic acid-binding protein